jgi:flagellar motor switch protein FliM
MTGIAANNLGREKVQQLLAAIGSGAADDSSKIQASEYNWKQPHCFSGEQLKKLEDFTKKLAQAAAEKFTTFYRSDFNAIVTSTTQHYASEFAGWSADNNYYPAFGTDPARPFGFIKIPHQTALAWVTQLLGDSTTEKDSARALSPLEDSLLFDIASAFISSFASAHSSFGFKASQNITKGQLPFEMPASQEFCKITLAVKKASDSTAAETDIVIPCSSLESVVGKIAQAETKFAANDISKAIINNLQNASVPVSVQLACASLTFEEVIGLQPGDILVLDKRIDQPSDLLILGHKMFQCYLAKTDGNQAVVIAGRTETNT